MTTKKKVTFYADDDIVAWLTAESERVGAPVGELCRRAMRLAALAQPTPLAFSLENQQRLELFEKTRTQPVLRGCETSATVLFMPKQETR